MSLLDRTEVLEAAVRALSIRMDKVDPPPAAMNIPGHPPELLHDEDEGPAKAKGSPKK